jgi:antitoxin component YwqK of YwqJK toxin-antitoxin module
VSDDNKRYLEYVKQGEYTFKNHLKDGRWVSLNFRKDTTSKHIVTYIKNGLKNGVESRYFAGSDKKYAEIEYRDGIKNGQEIHWNGNGTIKTILNYQNGVLDGPIINNWTEGEKHYTGYFRNGFQDSIWTYWENSRKDTIWVYYDEPRKTMEYKYVNGRKLLLNAWDYTGSKMIINGNGSLVLREYGIITTEYIDGQKNGLETRMSFDSTLEYSRSYDKGLLTNEIVHSPNGDTISYYSYSYPLPTIIDTMERWAEEYVNGDTYYKLELNHQPKYNGLCFEKFDNGIYKFKGHYSDGERVGQWTWYYPSGIVRIFANYKSNDWKYFDKLGNEVPTDFKGEYITELTNYRWFLNKNLEQDKVILSIHNQNVVTLKFVFNQDGTFVLNDYLECGKDIGSTGGGWDIIGNRLRIDLPEQADNIETVTTYNFEIIEVTDIQIILKRIK